MTGVSRRSKSTLVSTTCTATHGWCCCPACFPESSRRRAWKLGADVSSAAMFLQQLRKASNSETSETSGSLPSTVLYCLAAETTALRHVAAHANSTHLSKMSVIMEKL